jgi:hypothetical protein
MVGLAPAADGYVFKLSRVVPSSGDTKLFRLKTTYAFFTGKIPTDCRSLRPSTFIDTVNSYKLTCSFRLT